METEVICEWCDKNVDGAVATCGSCKDCGKGISTIMFTYCKDCSIKLKACHMCGRKNLDSKERPEKYKDW